MLPTIKKILYATDLSECARHAMNYVATLAQACQAEVTVLTVLPDALEDLSEAAGLDLEHHFGAQAVQDFRATALSRTRQELHQRITETAEALARETGSASPFPFHELLVEPGDPAKRILEYAKDFHLVVMGTHGKSGILGRLMGSVAERVVRASEVPVLVVRLPEPGGAD